MSKAPRTAIVSFIAVFVVVVAVGGVASVVIDDGESTTGPDHIEVENPQFDAERVASDSSPGEASVEMDSTAFQKKVVVHVGAAYTQRDIAPLVNTLIENGHEVTVLAQEGRQFGGGQITFAKGTVDQIAPPTGDDGSQLTGNLEGAQGLVSLGVTTYTDQDLNAIDTFVEENGRIVMGVEPTQEFGFGAGHSQTYSNLGVFTEPGYVYNLAENDLNYQRIFTEPSGTELLTEDVERVVFPSATPVQASNQDETMLPIEGSELSVTREKTEKPVLVRDQNVALIGDTDFLTPENTQRADNDVLVGNIADYLVEADRDVGDNNTEKGEEETESITIEVGPDGENRFSPEVTEIKPGTTVKFVWNSSGHNIVPTNQQPSDAEWGGVPETKEEGYVHEFTFEQEGTHEFVSEPHEEDGMYGVIIVGEP
ncbi:plastocyanin/azurin family copper-binding protein [Halovenus rubra]|uniref:Plastocyanin/azurin family copper-binding protein n=2 Tax=Halovenus rubra TaxID=869890 RepID=A0ABD5XC77_9EURY|nr:plastocyanin/azurin family copper-binding protein [Halovenus rubra]